MKKNKDVINIMEVFGLYGAIDRRNNNYIVYGKPQGQYLQLLVQTKSGYIEFYQKHKFFKKPIPQEYGSLFHKYGLTFLYINRMLYIIRNKKIINQIEII
ncbi:hypothetical protein F10086_6 [Staphylococcus phage vB_SauM_JDF86]|nr:hypothetical protein F10086_6 [Staphylococcus phage vB_SauM_JDF86]